MNELTIEDKKNMIDNYKLVYRISIIISDVSQKKTTFNLKNGLLAIDILEAML